MDPGVGVMTSPILLPGYQGFGHGLHGGCIVATFHLDVIFNLDWILIAIAH